MENEFEDDDEIAGKLGSGAEHFSQLERFIPSDIRTAYEVYSYKHAAALLANSAVPELNEILDALRNLKIPREWIVASGGNESAIPKALSKILRPRGWNETRIKCDLLVTLEIQKETPSGKEITLDRTKKSNFVDGHKIDYLKNRVAFDLEWNSKDQTFDRDLVAMRAFHEYGVITAGIIVTRSADLNEVFAELGVKNKYGASTTWIGKLLSRLDAGRNGSCPILVFGITQKQLADI